MSNFLEIMKAVLAGIVEGITEWLPVSSTGHLILLDEIWPMQNISGGFKSMFDVVIQLGAIMAVVVLFFHKLNPFSPKKSRRQKRRTWDLWFKVIVAVLPSAVLGLLLDDWMDEHLFNGFVVALMLIVYGVAFIYVENRHRGVPPKIRSTFDISYKTAILIGMFQVLSLIPGTSRSGATILGAIILGVGRPAAAEFSFFLAIPTMFGASLLKGVKYVLKGLVMSNLEVWILIVGCVVSFIVSLVAIKALMEYVRRHSFSAFGVYRIILGIVVLLYFGGRLLLA